MAKASVDVGHLHTASEIEAILRDYLEEQDEVSSSSPSSSSKLLASHKKLYGGFSGANYRVETVGRRALSPTTTSSGTTEGSDEAAETATSRVCVYVVKVLNGYDAPTAEAMAQVQGFLAQSGFGGCCHAVPLLSTIVTLIKQSA